MHIQLFISEHATEGHRLQAALQHAMPGLPITRHQVLEDVGREIRTAYSERNVAVIMVAGRVELAELAQRKNTWDRLWTILVLPDSEPEIISLGHALRPRFMTFTGSDFSDVVAVLKHIRESVDRDICN